MALKLFKCCTDARASEGHVGMQVHFGSALLDKAPGVSSLPWEACDSSGGLDAPRGCCLCDRCCAGLIALQTLTTLQSVGAEKPVYSLLFLLVSADVFWE